MVSRRVDPAVRTLLENLAAQGRPPLETLSPVEARAAAEEGIRAMGGTPEPVRSIEDLTIPGPLGDIAIRVYTPEEPGPRPAVVYYHGGGWVVCNLDTHQVVCSAIARRAGAVVVAVDYRLAPEHKFPAAVLDAYAGLQWTVANAERLGIDRNRISVGGDSAGGNLAAVVCLKSRDEKGPAIASQILVYPVTDLSSFETFSYEEFKEEHYLTRAQMEWFRNHYLADPADAKNPYASPLLAPDLSRLPRAMIILAQCDPLLDEGDAYRERLRAAGSSADSTMYVGMIHPFFTLSGVIPQASRAIDQFAEAVRRADARPRSSSDWQRW